MARRLFTADPGPAVLRWGWFLWLAWAVVGTGLLGEDRGGGFALGLVLSAPFWALWLLWPVYRGWAWLTRRGGRRRDEEWQAGTGPHDPGPSQTSDKDRAPARDESRDR